jgi:hypothetical protein
MRTQQLQFNNLSSENFEWVQRKYKAIDTMNLSEYAGFIAEDCSLQFANNAIAQGKEVLLRSFNTFLKSIFGIDHSFINMYQVNHTLILEALITYTLKGNKTVAIPAVIILELKNRLAISIRIFMDMTFLNT